MNVRDFNPENDMSDVLRWLKGHKQGDISADILPPNGFVIDGICAGWLYLTDSPVSLFGWPVGNFDKSPKVIYEGFSKLILHVQKFAVEAGCPVIFTYTNQHGLLKLYKKLGFFTGETELTGIIFNGGNT